MIIIIIFVFKRDESGKVSFQILAVTVEAFICARKLYKGKTRAL